MHHAPPPFSELVETAVNLSWQEYEQFLQAVNQQRAQQRSDVLPKAEADLLKKIYRPFSPKSRSRLDLLNSKIWDESLTEVEHKELLQLIESQEKWAAQRMRLVAKLALLRNTDYATLAQQLGLAVPKIHA